MLTTHNVLSWDKMCELINYETNEATFNLYKHVKEQL